MLQGHRGPRSQWWAVAVVMGLAVGTATHARAGDAPREPAAPAPPAPVDPPGTYAGRDAAWWVGQLRGVGTHQVAREALKVMGSAALPAILDAFGDPDPVVRRLLRELAREPSGDLRPTREALGRALDVTTDPDDVALLMGFVDRLGDAAAPLVPNLLRHIGGNSSTGQRVLQRVQQLGGPAEALVPRLRELLRGDDPAAKLLALRMIEGFGAEAAPATPDIVPLLQPQQAPMPRPTRSAARTDLRLAAITALGAVGTAGAEGREALATIVASGDPALGAAAAKALAQISTAEPEALDHIVALLASEDSRVRLSAMASLPTLQRPPPAMLQPLLAMLVGPPPSQGMAVAALRRIDLEPGVLIRAVLGALKPPREDSQARSLAAELARAEPVAFVEALSTAPAGIESFLWDVLSALSSELSRSPGRTAAITWMLARIRTTPPSTDVDPRQLWTLRTVLGDVGDVPDMLAGLVTGPDGPARRAALQLLGDLPAGAGTLALWLDSPDVSVRKAAIESLARAGRELTAAEDDAVVRALDDPIAELRAAAASALIAPRTGRRTAYARPDAERRRLSVALVDLLRRPGDPAARGAALSALISLRIPVPEAVDPLFELLFATEDLPSVEMVCNALIAVAAGDTRAIRVRLAAALAPGQPEQARASACLALVALGERRDDVLAALPSLLTEGPWPARWRALVATRQLGATAAALEPAVRDLVSSSNHGIATEACRALAAIAPTSDAARRAVAALALERQKVWRAAAITTLPSFGVAAVDDLLRCRDDLEMRVHVWSALVELGPLAHDALPALEETLRASPKDAALRNLVQSLRLAPPPDRDR
ncbi:MAG: HEAT repeat domain-containing protein [Planctomycetia bacterium]|nr:HEAT repeat domain-containing protein [Planctomycetia bacterium]